jgi:hypothetical protein
MAKLFRRSWEKWGFGRAGQLSSIQSAKSGTDGVISGAAYSGAVAIFQSASGSFNSNDVGRKIRLVNTPNKRFDGLYVIDSINSTTSVNLRYNHNVTGSPASPAKFYENGTTISWRVFESCTFTADVANDIQGWHAGSYVNIEGSANRGNRGQWLISHVLTNRTCILSKGYLFWPAEVGSASTYAVYSAPDLLWGDFVAESTLQWSITDPEPLSGTHAYYLFRQQLIDSGWTVLQTRGPSNVSASAGFLDDTILKSTGETDAATPQGKMVFFRMTLIGWGRASPGVYTSINFGGSVFLHWDVTLTAGGVPGSGIAGMRWNLNNTSTISPSPSIPTSSTNEFVLDSLAANIDLLTPGRDNAPLTTSRRDMVVVSDADEFVWYTNQTGVSGGYFTWGVTSIKPIGQNQSVVAITAATTGSGPYSVNTGTVSLASLGYQVGDNITIRGLSTSPTEYIETTIITGFDTSDPLNNKVLVQSLSQVYGQGPESIKGFIGEDPYNICMFGMSSSSMTNRFHNSAKLGNATGKDWDATNFGVSATNIAGLPTFTDLTPNRRTGRFGISTLQFKDTTRLEFRGRSRFMWVTDLQKIPQGKKLQNPVDGMVYVVVSPGIATNQGMLLGPIPKLQAGFK